MYIGAYLGGDRRFFHLKPSQEDMGAYAIEKPRHGFGGEKTEMATTSIKRKRKIRFNEGSNI